MEKDTAERLKMIEKYIDKMEETFDKAGIYYGDVEFVCPICGGLAIASRHRAPVDAGHTEDFRSDCIKCGFHMGNY